VITGGRATSYANAQGKILARDFDEIASAKRFQQASSLTPPSVGLLPNEGIRNQNGGQ